ncbi:MAG: hypothetical protein UT43_C0011G0012 [Parcubacteria group bacterium GW2011_GWC1_39_29]|nr:MAG: hypothetical protein UT43_C0011G0012 [Parcubacteria group bacterium GW2011_GWC1_39_29]
MDLLEAEAILARANNRVQLIKNALKQEAEAIRVSPTTDEIENKFDEILSAIRRHLVDSRQINLDQHHGSITFNVTNDFEGYQSPGTKRKTLVPSKKNVALAKAVQKKLTQEKFTVMSRIEVYRGDHADPDGVQIVFRIEW